MHKQQESRSQARPVLDIRGVTKTFGSHTVVQTMDLTVNVGEIFGFLGPNGAGKTTTIKLLLDILRPTAGVIELFGISNRQTAETHARLGYLSGDMILDEDLTGRQYLAFVASTYGGDYRARQQELAGLLQADLDVKIGNYSRGNRQKIGLIAALMHQPDLLILDEPSSGFDPLMQEVFIKLIQEFRAGGGTVFMSSHTLGEVQRLCDRVAFIRDGRIVGITDVDELNRTATKRVHIVADKVQITALRHAAGQVAGLTQTEASATNLTFSYGGGIQTLLRFLADYTLDDMTLEEPDLEELFLSYYQEQKPVAGKTS